MHMCVLGVVLTFICVSRPGHSSRCSLFFLMLTNMLAHLVSQLAVDSPCLSS